MQSQFAKAVAFFRTHAMFSWSPATETREQGRLRCARAMAHAELQAASAGFSFAWTHDDETGASFRDTDSPYWLWVCMCRDSEGRTLASLCGIDLGRDGCPHSDPYARTVRAELAMESLDMADIAKG